MMRAEGRTMRSAAPSPRRLLREQRGMTLLELIIACAILMILATAAMPVARFTVKRQKEAELHRSLREVRDAIDRYKDAADKGRIRVEVGTEGYPPDLQTLVSGVDVVSQGVAGAPLGAGTAAGLGIGGAAGSVGALFGATNPASTFNTAPGSGTGTAPLSQRIRFLRQIPIDPMTGRAEWGLRAVQDDSDSSSWGGRDVFDVYSLSQGTGLNNIKYSDW
jgi:general secretion pathway protein G